VKVSGTESPIENGEILSCFATEDVQSSFHDIVVGTRYG
jgi:hypothetical protein